MDCSNFKNFAVERERMCLAMTNGTKKCNKGNAYGGIKCPLFSIAENRCFSEPEKAICIVQEWSDKNPIETRMRKALELLPNLRIGDNGIPLACAGDIFGFSCYTKSAEKCAKCWATPYHGNL